jgi:GTP cyclohydrolase I
MTILAPPDAPSVADLLPPTGIDRAAAEVAVADLLRALGRDLADPHLAETPRRVTEAFLELLTPLPHRWTVFPNSDGYDDIVMVRDIPFHSVCAHHLLPFSGTARIGYVPGERLMGLSKLARGLDLFARDLQIQERLTVQVADWLEQTLQPRGAAVLLEAEHLCMAIRGAHVSGTMTRTAATRGVLAQAGPLQDRFFA